MNISQVLRVVTITSTGFKTSQCSSPRTASVFKNNKVAVLLRAGSGHKDECLPDLTILRKVFHIRRPSC